MNKLYWVVRYKAKGKRRARPVVTTMRRTRFDSIRAAVDARGDMDWKDMERELNLECVKVRILDPAPKFSVSMPLSR